LKEHVVGKIFAAAWLTVSFVATASPGAAKEPLGFRAVPASGFGPINLVVQTFIEPDARNRSVEITVDSGDYFTSSTAELDGDHAPRTRQVLFRQLRAGDYVVRVTLMASDGPRATATGYVWVF
jgi:hypothetical protein